MKTLGTIKKLMSYPFRLVLIPLALPIWFFMTDFEDPIDVETLKQCVHDWIRPYSSL